MLSTIQAHSFLLSIPIISIFLILQPSSFCHYLFSFLHTFLACHLSYIYCTALLFFSFILLMFAGVIHIYPLGLESVCHSFISWVEEKDENWKVSRLDSSLRNYMRAFNVTSFQKSFWDRTTISSLPRYCFLQGKTFLKSLPMFYCF